MDPNTNQPIGTSPLQQPAVPQAVATPPVQPAAPIVASQNPNENSKKGMGKGIILFVILVLLAIGIVIYILFAKNQMNNTQKTATDNNSSAIPTPTSVPTLAPEEDLEIVNPEADLLELDSDVKSL